MGDDEVIRRKLLVDGDGLGDDRRITTLLRTVMKWSNSEESEQETMVNYERMMATLAQCESTMVKSRYTTAMYQAEMKNYESLCEQIENSIADAHKKLENCKTELLEAKRIRKNRQEYDVLAKVIQTHPDRKETMRKLQKLSSELSQFQKTKEALEDKLNLRRKHFAVLSNALQELQGLLEDDELEEGDIKEQAMET